MFYDQAMGVDSLVRLAFRGGVGHSGVFHGVVPEKKTCPEGEVIDRKFHFNFMLPYERGIKWVYGIGEERDGFLSGYPGHLPYL